MTVVVGDVNDKEITARISVRERERPQTAIFDPDWGRIDDGSWRLRPPGIGIKKPLQVGKEWRSDANGVHLQSGVTFRAEGIAKVVGGEQVTTEAGTFDTFRVDMTVRMINTKDQTRSQTYTFVVWYAPAVNRWVKRTTEWRSERPVTETLFFEIYKDFSTAPTR